MNNIEIIKDETSWTDGQNIFNKVKVDGREVLIHVISTEISRTILVITYASVYQKTTINRRDGIPSYSGIWLCIKEGPSVPDWIIQLVDDLQETWESV